jgi:hypothetical protein
VTSLWPLRYFVALCIEMSTPIASTGWLMGQAKVLSTIEVTPAALQAAATARTSTQRSVGLIGDSNHTSLVRGPRMLAGSASASSDTNRPLMPNRGSRLAIR